MNKALARSGKEATALGRPTWQMMAAHLRGLEMGPRILSCCQIQLRYKKEATFAVVTLMPVNPAVNPSTAAEDAFFRAPEPRELLLATAFQRLCALRGGADGEGGPLVQYIVCSQDDGDELHHVLEHLGCVRLPRTTIEGKSSTVLEATRAQAERALVTTVRFWMLHHSQRPIDPAHTARLAVARGIHESKAALKTHISETLGQDSTRVRSLLHGSEVSWLRCLTARAPSGTRFELTNNVDASQVRDRAFACSFTLLMVLPIVWPAGTIARPDSKRQVAVELPIKLDLANGRRHVLILDPKRINSACVPATYRSLRVIGQTELVLAYALADILRSAKPASIAVNSDADPGFKALCAKYGVGTETPGQIVLTLAHRLALWEQRTAIIAPSDR